MSGRPTATIALALALLGALAVGPAAAQVAAPDVAQGAAQDAAQDVAGVVPELDTADLPRWPTRGPDAPVLLGDWFELVAEADLDTLDNGAAGTPVQRLERLEVGVQGVDEEWLVGDPLLELGGEDLRLRVPIRSVRQGEKEFVGVAVRAEGQVVALLEPVTVSVALDLPAGRLPRLAEPKRGLEIPVPAGLVWPWVVGLGLALTLIGLWVGATTRRVPQVVHVVPPEIVAGRALAALRARLPSSQEEVPPFIDAVSHVLRVYIEDAFRLRAPELTTEEFLGELARRQGDVVAARRDVLEQFLVRCDLVKFAGHEPALSEVVSLIDVAERFVDETHTAPPSGPEQATAVGETVGAGRADA